MDKDMPTQEEQRHLWEWCGFRFKLSASENPHYWIDPQGHAVSELPPIDLNSLFKYVMNLLRERDLNSYFAVLVQWSQALIQGEDPAPALFRALYEVMKNENKTA